MNNTASKAHVCDICDETFESEAELEQHIRDQGLVH